METVITLKIPDYIYPLIEYIPADMLADVLSDLLVESIEQKTTLSVEKQSQQNVVGREELRQIIDLIQSKVVVDEKVEDKSVSSTTSNVIETPLLHLDDFDDEDMEFLSMMK